jgi:DNA-binding NtrC family response regulator
MLSSVVNSRDPLLAHSALSAPQIERAINRSATFVGMVSQCAEMQKIFSIVEKVAPTPTTVLILGESGTGKELIAKALHRLSGRSGRLVPVNCGAIPEDILESELFGHERGAFTGAISNRVGRFQLADGGTIFLDEIGEMSPKLQVKLLRVLQERKIEPVGSVKSIDIDVRVIAATNKDLREEVKAGRFREDLFYRLQVVPVELPALRKRGSDVELLVQHFMRHSCEVLGKKTITIAPETLERMRAYHWPGNIREMENLIERLALLAEGDVLQEHELPEHMREGQACQIVETHQEMPQDGLDFNALVEDYEKRLITMALTRTNGNKKAAAQLLRLNRTTLVEKIKKKGLEKSIEVFSSDENGFFEDSSTDLDA